MTPMLPEPMMTRKLTVLPSSVQANDLGKLHSHNLITNRVAIGYTTVTVVPVAPSRVLSVWLPATAALWKMPGKSPTRHERYALRRRPNLLQFSFGGSTLITWRLQLVRFWTDGSQVWAQMTRIYR